MDDNKDKPQHLGPADTPFELQDGHVAFALYLAGVPFYNDKAWCRNVYTREMLLKHGFKGADMREAAKHCVLTNKRGMVRFYFQRIPILQKLLKVFSKQEDDLERKEGKAVDEYKSILALYKEGKINEEEVAVRIACVLLKARMAFMSGWREVPPHIRVQGPVSRSRFPFVDEKGRHGTGTKDVTSFKEFSAYATDEQLKKVGLL